MASCLNHCGHSLTAGRIWDPVGLVPEWGCMPWACNLPPLRASKLLGACSPSQLRSLLHPSPHGCNGSNASVSVAIRSTSDFQMGDCLLRVWLTRLLSSFLATFLFLLPLSSHFPPGPGLPTRLGEV